VNKDKAADKSHVTAVRCTSYSVQRSAQLTHRPSVFSKQQSCSKHIKAAFDHEHYVIDVRNKEIKFGTVTMI
jgi:hypothetical protein